MGHWRSTHVGRTARAPRLRAANDNGRELRPVHLLALVMVLILSFLLDRVWAAELAVPRPRVGPTVERPVDSPNIDCCFGTYSLDYMRRRWQRMCEGPQRYDAMREASERGQPQPCR